MIITLLPETGAGGFSDTDNVLVLAFDPGFFDMNQCYIDCTGV